MPYKDRAKQRSYQRNWVRQKRGKHVEPDVEPMQEIRVAVRAKQHIEPQSYNPMMVGYVPPVE